MSIKVRLLLAGLVFAAALSTPALCAIYPVQLDPGKWCNIGGTCTYDLALDWPYRPNGVDVWLLCGCAPPSGQDPRIRQDVYNSSEDTWTDWHVAIENGANLRDVRVYKVGEGTLWPYELLPDVCGFFAHVITSGNPQNPMAVEPGATLHVEFVYDVAGTPVNITQYPTDWYAIPEPSSMAALAVGLCGAVCGARRRFKK